MPSELITSAQNPKVKRLLALQKDSSLRRESGLFVVEGRRELEHCMAAGFEPDTVFVCPDLYSPAPCDLCSGTVAARDRVNGRGPRAKRSGRDERSEVPGFARGPLPFTRSRAATVPEHRSPATESSK